MLTIISRPLLTTMSVLDHYCLDRRDYIALEEMGKDYVLSSSKAV